MQRMECMGPSPFLKWPGGKRWLAPLLVQIIRPELKRTYFEPFLGAGAVFLSLSPKQAVLSDCNEDLITTLRIIRENSAAVVEAVHRFSNTNECYYQVRQMKTRSEISRAARFLYLNRTCWGGIYRLNKQGTFNVPFGNSGRVICERRTVIEGAHLLRGVILECLDFEKAIERAGEGDVIYADPPYTTRGQNNGFVRYNERLFAWSDQDRLASACRQAASRGAFVVVSGLWHRDLLRLYTDWWAAKISRASTVSREVGGRGKVYETLLFSRKPGLSEKKLATLGCRSLIRASAIVTSRKY